MKAKLIYSKEVSFITFHSTLQDKITRCSTANTNNKTGRRHYYKINQNATKVSVQNMSVFHVETTEVTWETVRACHTQYEINASSQYVMCFTSFFSQCLH